MPVPVVERLDALAKEAGVSRSEVVRSALALLDPANFAALAIERLYVGGQ